MDILNWAYRSYKNSIRKQIRKGINKKRLVLLGTDNALYINKEGKRINGNFKEIARVLVEADKSRAERMTLLGVTEQDIVSILEEEYESLHYD